MSKKQRKYRVIHPDGRTEISELSEKGLNAVTSQKEEEPKEQTQPEPEQEKTKK